MAGLYLLLSIDWLNSYHQNDKKAQLKSAMID
ncbi:hypothetical protein E9M_03679 [Moraxella catarrhalis 46P47B1]|nr:hypothetical protein E9G_02183 [Moraxella catarrhalis 7169]EGE13568.1 hypothetical protein E9M_03679 [Moraxella catarrhalis 46P47B1]EGE13681.1 hypothetical protein E9O_08809 [Moraxella catarrhalis 12P80B1]EGE16116.1 hypothetical protein E9K_02521 [Moraxella catarrhalis 103P14B1]EGE18979.1 hypothetical protein E9Q_02708 [Moraxella catarrhalis BC1]EGE19272.1 hypothetical protein E9S_06845 [Moraxella catarrhalis BC7]EGE21889.1 hypothetical protein E9U_01521 [Moraxella catarrhalis BC8]EGE2532